MKNLFSDFPPADAAQWRKQIERDLKGEPFDTLLWKNENDITVQPFYTSEDLPAEYFPAFSHSEWRVATQAQNNKHANTSLLKQLRHGADAVWIDYSKDQTEAALRNVDLDIIALSVTCSAKEMQDAAKILSGRKVDSPAATIFPHSLSSAGEIKEWISGAEKVTPAATWQCVPASGWGHGGALPVYELALTLACIVQMLDASKATGNNSIVVRIAVDSNLFVQVAKLRALRRLWEILNTELKTKSTLYIQCETTLINKSALDPSTNLLRSAVEATAAILGGCNELLVHPHDTLSERSDMGVRLALNQQHILREECYFDKVADVSCGSYYIETLTDALAERALEKFKSIMNAGGYVALAESGEIAKELARQADSKKQRISSLQELVIGVNKFRQPGEKTINQELLSSMQRQGVAALVAEYEKEQSGIKA